MTTSNGRMRVLLAAACLALAVPAFADMAETAEIATSATEAGHDAEALAANRQAADRGDPVAQRTAGLMLLYGEQVHRDLAAAKGYLAKAATQGCPMSAHMLGKLAACGESLCKAQTR